MKLLITVAFVTLTLLSCAKEKRSSIVGIWKEVSTYSQDNAGNYYWSEAPRFSYILLLKDDGTYSGWQCFSTGAGFYQYDHANKQIELEDRFSGSTETISVSDLNDDYLILDYGITSIGRYKTKFIRSVY